MPIQNVGTLIENLVVAEAAALLISHSPGRDLGFVNAFAMPTLSEWRPHGQSVGISDSALARIAAADGKSEFLAAMGACLRRFPGQGPNAALLVSLVSRRQRTALHVWVNDIIDGPYGNAIVSLERLQDTVDQICTVIRSPVEVRATSAPYPTSIAAAAAAVRSWGGQLGGLLAFLDPMRYVLARASGPYTSSIDHRQWLTAVGVALPTLTVQFTGNSDSNALQAELTALRADLIASGFENWLEVRRQHYVVSVGSNQPGLLVELEKRVRAAWREWCDHVPEIVTRDLNILKSTEPANTQMRPARR
jgi:hypothetical protein